MRDQEGSEKARQLFEHMQQQAESRIARPSDDIRRLQIELQEVQKAAEGQVSYVARQAELDRERGCEGAPDAWSEAGSCTSAVDEL